MAVLPEDEYLHHPPAGTQGLFHDNFWFSICDRDADVFGVIHIHASLDRGYARFSNMLSIDGIAQPWANKASIPHVQKFNPLTEGHLAYYVVKPLEQFRITFDGPEICPHDEQPDVRRK